MKRSLFIGTLFLLLLAAIQSNAEMRMTPSGITFSDNSTQTTALSGGGISAPLHLAGSFSTIDYSAAPDGATISGVNNYSGVYSAYGGYFEATGRYGIGVYGSATDFGDAFNFGGYFEASGTFGTGVYGSANGTGNISNYGGYFESAEATYGTGVRGSAGGSSGTGVYGYASNAGNVTNYGGYFEAEGISGRGVAAYGRQYDFYAAGPGANYGPFTGAHEVKFAQDMPKVILPGMISSVTGRTVERKDKNGVISLSSTLPTVIISTKPKDNAVFGVIVSNGPLPEDHWYKAEEGERFGVVNALGEGRVWVTDINGKIKAGDYITTSSVPGYGQMQDDDLLHSYTLGKAIETFDWEQVTETVQYNGKAYKRYLIAVVYTSG